MPGPVAVLPLCPVACGSALARVHGELWAVVVVKATFALAHERSAWPVTADPIVEADEHLGGHPTSSVLAASDLALELPGAGVTLMGAAHAAPGTTRTAVRLAIFQGGAAVINKHLVVSGDATRDAPTPKAFTRMPIVYERAFGGPSVAENPAGVGSGRSGPLPNIVDPREPERPAGFGPIARSWAPRVRAMRALDGAPREGVVVVLENEPDFSMFHAAPADQRLEILRGDEWVVVDGMHPAHPRVQTQLPFAHAEARFARADKPGPLTPISLRADTMTIDAERMVASVIWRGHVVIESVEVAAQLRVYVGLELPGLPIRWPEAPKAAAPKDEIWPDLPDTTTERDVRAIRAALLAQAPPAIVAGAPDDDDLDATTEIAGAIARAVMPFDRDARPAPAIAAPADAVDRVPTDTVSQLIPAGMVLPFGGTPGPTPALPLAPPPLGAPIAPAPAEVSAAPRAGLAAQIAARIAAKASLADLVFVGADLPGVDLATADLSGLDLSRANLAAASLAGAKLVGAKLEGADLAGARLDGADLTRADLARTNLRGASLDGAVLERTNFTYARGDGARLVGARGAGTTFARGQWDAATFDDVEMPEADFTGASLANARFIAARLDRARFVDVRGANASFEGARFGACVAVGASFPGASLKLVVAPGSSWEGSDLGGASLDGVDLSGANLLRVAAPGAQLGHANLSGANLQRVVAPGASCVAADLRGADLRYARLAKASFEGANLRDVHASFADLGGARFVDADLSHADMRDATFDGADLTRARLDGADLRDVDLSGANLTGAQRHGTKLAGARLPKT